MRLPEEIRPPPRGGTGEDREDVAGGWAYVLPLPDHAIVNLGNAFVKFSAGELRSNIHRVVPSPGVQGRETRYSLVYFSRPEDEVVLRVLRGGEVVEEALRERGSWMRIEKGLVVRSGFEEGVGGGRTPGDRRGEFEEGRWWYKVLGVLERS